ncbi:hypothetical protein Ahy_A01g002631 isoform C [Arachis hypogaea]|uniref:Uncharacterized protein n=1 Tax=Arachis hypogaea TaxID=3818 RepID=A0A445ERF3_ARAHY|nr:hypothetical protein Ahy_A01g002631 isoform C [Arachis hypogaea]
MERRTWRVEILSLKVFKWPPYAANELKKKLNNLWCSWRNWLLKARGQMPVNLNQGHFKS